MPPIKTFHFINKNSKMTLTIHDYSFERALAKAQLTLTNIEDFTCKERPDLGFTSTHMILNLN